MRSLGVKTKNCLPRFPAFFISPVCWSMGLPHWIWPLTHQSSVLLISHGWTPRDNANLSMKSKSIKPEYLSNRPQVSMVYKLINHTGCWKNTKRICKPRAAGEWFTNSLSVLPTSQVVYQPITHRKLVVYCFYLIIQKTRDFSVGLPAQ